jgi:hypothetical protein
MPNSGNLLLASFSDSDAAALRPHLKAVHLESEKILFEAGGEIADIYFPTGAIVSLVVGLSSGEIIEAAMVGKDGVVGASAALGGNIPVNRGIVQLGGTRDDVQSERSGPLTAPELTRINATAGDLWDKQKHTAPAPTRAALEGGMHVEAIAATPQGKVRGRLSDGVYVFKGISYAAAPFGAHRFLPPQPVEPWGGVRDALAFGPKPPQLPYPPPLDVLFPEGVASGEDCLNLNVWSPEMGAARRPVMVCDLPPKKWTGLSCF